MLWDAIGQESYSYTGRSGEECGLLWRVWAVLGIYFNFIF